MEAQASDPPTTIPHLTERYLRAFPLGVAVFIAAFMTVYGDSHKWNRI
jgi:hypothetical protein